MHTIIPLHQIVFILLLTCCLALVSCADEPTLDPPEVRWGQDVCAECGMILSDDRYAAAVVAIYDGERHEYLYDDLGEMLAHPPDTKGSTRQWARDMQTREWINTSTAHFVRSRLLHTPMGYGVVAFANLQDAKTLSDENDGELLALHELSATDPHSHDAAPAEYRP